MYRNLESSNKNDMINKIIITRRLVNPDSKEKKDLKYWACAQLLGILFWNQNTNSTDASTFSRLLEKFSPKEIAKKIIAWKQHIRSFKSIMEVIYLKLSQKAVLWWQPIWNTFLLKMQQISYLFQVFWNIYIIK